MIIGVHATAKKVARNYASIAQKLKSMIRDAWSGLICGCQNIPSPTAPTTGPLSNRTTQVSPVFLYVDPNSPTRIFAQPSRKIGLFQHRNPQDKKMSSKYFPLPGDSPRDSDEDARSPLGKQTIPARPPWHPTLRTSILVTVALVLYSVGISWITKVAVQEPHHHQLRAPASSCKSTRLNPKQHEIASR